MKLRYKNKEIPLIECVSFYSRFKGFMLCKNIDKALMFNKCNSVHTFFMYNNIDVIMCDKDNNIMYYYRNLGRNRIILPKRGVSIVYETPSNFFNVEIDEKLEVIR